MNTPGHRVDRGGKKNPPMLIESRIRAYNGKYRLIKRGKFTYCYFLFSVNYYLHFYETG